MIEFLYISLGILIGAAWLYVPVIYSVLFSGNPKDAFGHLPQDIRSMCDDFDQYTIEHLIRAAEQSAIGEPVVVSNNPKWTKVRKQGWCRVCKCVTHNMYGDEYICSTGINGCLNKYKAGQPSHAQPCVQCGTPTLRITNLKSVCSSECYDEWQHKRAREPLSVHRCFVCSQKTERIVNVGAVKKHICSDYNCNAVFFEQYIENLVCDKRHENPMAEQITYTAQGGTSPMAVWTKGEGTQYHFPHDWDAYLGDLTATK